MVKHFILKYIYVIKYCQSQFELLNYYWKNIHRRLEKIPPSKKEDKNKKKDKKKPKDEEKVTSESNEEIEVSNEPEVASDSDVALTDTKSEPEKSAENDSVVLPEGEPEEETTPDEPKQKKPKGKKKGRKKKEESEEPKSKEEIEATKLDLEVVPEVAPEGEKKEKPEDKAEAEPEDKTEAEPEDKTEGKPKKITEKEPETDLETELEDKLDVTPEEQDDVEEEKAVDELLESISIEYTDFFPTKDSITVIAHLDVDGILCVSAINQMIMSIKEPTTDSETEGDLGNKLRVFFTSPLKIFSTLAKSIPDINKIDEDDFSIGKLFLCDLSLNRDTLLGSSIYDSVKWFDHH